MMNKGEGGVYLLRVSDLRAREVINIIDGRRLGYIGDLDIDLDAGRVRGIVVPGQGKLLGLFGRDNDVYIPWEKIVKIGADVILVDIQGIETPYLDEEM